MDFSTLQLKNLYDTSEDDLEVNFFEPILPAAPQYDRGAGFISSGWLKINATGTGAFGHDGEKVRWIISSILSKADREQFQIAAEGEWGGFHRNGLFYNVDCTIAEDDAIHIFQKRPDNN